MKCRFLLTLITLFVSAQGFAADSYKGPNALCATKDGTTLYVVNTDSHEIAVLNTADNKIAQTLSLGEIAPTAAALNSDESILYVTGGGAKGQILAVDLASGTISKKSSTGHTPQHVVLSHDGKTLFVCNQFSNNVGEYQLPELTLNRTFNVVREPRSAVATKDGKYVLVANFLPYAVTNFPENLSTTIHVAAEVSIINIASGETKGIRLPNGSGSMSSICLSPDGRFAYISNIIARFLIPTTQVERGWMNTAGIAIIDTTQLENEKNGFVNSVLLDDVDQGAANPHGITTSADGKKLYVAIAGTSELIVIDAESMHKKLNARAEAEKQAEAAGKPFTALATEDDFAFLVGLKTRIKLAGIGSRAIALAGSKIYAGMYFSDTVQVVDAETLKPAGEIALGPEPVWTPERRGEIYWNDATLCMQRWQSCASCHPDARMDAYNWDLLNDGMGNPKNSKSLLFTYKTPPSMIRGVRDNPASGWITDQMGIQCVRTGFQFIHFTMPDEAKCKDVDAYLWAEEPVPSPFLADGKLSEKAERGKKIFEDPKIGCASCHPAPLFTDQKMHDVGTKIYFNDTSEFDTPTLVELWRTAPYLHDGRYLTLQDVFKVGLHGDETGDVDGLTDAQIDDLVEYIQSL